MLNDEQKVLVRLDYEHRSGYTMVYCEPVYFGETLTLGFLKSLVGNNVSLTIRNHNMPAFCMDFSVKEKQDGSIYLVDRYQHECTPVFESR